jgi:hypothetical protein
LKVESEPKRFFLWFHYTFIIVSFFVVSIPAYIGAFSQKKVSYFLVGVIFHYLSSKAIHKINVYKFTIELKEHYLFYQSPDRCYRINYEDVQKLFWKNGKKKRGKREYFLIMDTCMGVIPLSLWNLNKEQTMFLKREISKRTNKVYQPFPKRKWMKLKRENILLFNP